MIVSIIIKVLNEERHIARAIESALAALAATAGGGEVILADSGSSDRTLAIAADYPIRVVQLTQARDRGCGAGPQLGYQYARHPHVCLIDGDMVLHPGFLPRAEAVMAAEPSLAGVSGLVTERNLSSIEFQRRVRRADPDLRPGAVDRLNGGGLYRRAAIESVGYLSDRNLHSYEEIELALRLRGRGWTLHRLDAPFVDHHGHSEGGFALLLRRFKTGYIFGIGEMLRAAWGKPHFRQTLRDLPEIRLWLAVLGSWAVLLGLMALAPSLATALAVPALAAVLLVAALSAEKRSIESGFYAAASWNAHAAGFLIGVLRPRVAPTRWLDSRILSEHEPAAPAARSPGGEHAAITFSVVALAVTLMAAPCRPARAEWVPVRDVSLAILPGSALDFSGMFPGAPAGTLGRVVIRPDGHLGFADRPAEPARFLCASLAWNPASGGYPDHATADTYADQLRRHGYNAARFHFLDANLMAGRRADFDVDPVALDRFRYLLGALKRNGIVWVVDAMTAPNGALAVENRDLKLGVHLDSAARAAWLRFVRLVLATPDPYTGSTPLTDPAMALVVLANENGLTFDAIMNELRTREGYPPSLRAPFNAWLRDTYGSDAALRTAWTTLDPGESLADGTVALPPGRNARGPRRRDLERFFAALQTDTAAWMTQRLRELGYPGLVSAYNNGSTTGESLGRATLPVITADVYHDEVDSLATPLTITGLSSLADDAAYVRAAAGVRWLDRPFAVLEYDHAFPNPTRHEAGLVFPAYAALQQWDLICRHAFGPIDLSFAQPWPQKRAILPYGLGLDPIGRAAETLAALLFRRGDVASARGTVAVRSGDATDLLADGAEARPDRETKLALRSRFGLVPTATALPPGALLLPDGAGAGAAPSVETELRAAGMLQADSATDVARGRFESDTGEITLDATRQRFTVVTPRTEAVSFTAVNTPLRLGHVTVVAADGPTTVAVSALDGAPLPRSHRVLVILASDARNTAMRFADAADHVVTDFGRMPVLIERRCVTLRLATDQPGGWRLSSLRLDGAPGEAIAVRALPDAIVAVLDNTAPRHGPTTFFLLERAP